MTEYNKKIVADKEYRQYKTDKYPYNVMAIFNSIESILEEHLPRAINIHNDDVKILKNAGAIIRKPVDSIMKSILVAVYDLEAKEVIDVGHHDCGMSHVD